MALGEIDEDTFVAFTDISGFKKYLISNSERAEYILKGSAHSGRMQVLYSIEWSDRQE